MMNLGSTTITQAMHERICLLFTKLQGDPVLVSALTEFDWLSDMGPKKPETEEVLLERLKETLAAYELFNGGEKHPLATELWVDGVFQTDSLFAEARPPVLL
ncbi:hypothetical protein [uncultured Shimia sp.]|uniref:hypothetical protein n=1 Tax=uncultured Shimia sp. TaxID=573152 RepID=UPI002623D486|nr:hypothetical protein [uncultured Shimia sp.]